MKINGVDHAIILVRITWLELLLNSIFKKPKNVAYFFDIYSKSHGFVLSFLSRFFGYRKISVAIERLGKLLGIRLRQIPHAHLIDDYHLIQINAQADTTKYLDDFYLKNTSINDTVLLLGVLDEKCLASLSLKEMGFRIWHILENIRVVALLGFSQIELTIDHREFPQQLLEKICQDHGVVIKYTRRFFKLPNSFIYGLFLFCFWWFNFFRCFLPKRKVRYGGRKFAIEFVDPSCNKGDATHPNYFIKNQEMADQCVAYVRPNRKKKFHSQEFVLPFNIPVIYLDKIPLYFSDIFSVLHNYMRLFVFMWKYNRSFYYFYKQIELLNFKLAFSALLRHSDIKLHVYNTLPNGRKCGMRNDSGLVTGLCRFFGVKSISYQTRTYYSHMFCYYFDVFDLYCYWGKAWKRALIFTQFIEKDAVIGSVFLNDELLKKVAKKTDLKDSNEKSIVLFTSDIDDVGDEIFPLSYTLDYTLKFLLATMKAVYGAQQTMKNMSNKIFLKTKDIYQGELILKLPFINEALKKYKLNIELISHERHDLKESISMADVVVSIGFTTPGLDALLAGKQSYYYTPYDFWYNDIFNSQSPMVFSHYENLLQEFITAKKLSDSFINELDCFRDGNASQRLWNICLSLLKEGKAK